MTELFIAVLARVGQNARFEGHEILHCVIIVVKVEQKNLVEVQDATEPEGEVTSTTVFGTGDLELCRQHDVLVPIESVCDSFSSTLFDQKTWDLQVEATSVVFHENLIGVLLDGVSDESHLPSRVLNISDLRWV